MKKTLAFALITVSLTACSQAPRVADSAPVLLGDVNNVDMYAQDVKEIATEQDAPEIIEQFDELLNSETEGVEGTPAQKVLATQGLEQFFEDYAKVTEYSVDFERNLFACHVDNTPENVQECTLDLYTATYDN